MDTVPTPTQYPLASLLLALALENFISEPPVKRGYLWKSSAVLAEVDVENKAT